MHRKEQSHFAPEYSRSRHQRPMLCNSRRKKRTNQKSRLRKKRLATSSRWQRPQKSRRRPQAAKSQFNRRQQNPSPSLHQSLPPNRSGCRTHLGKALLAVKKIDWPTERCIVGHEDEMDCRSVSVRVGSCTVAVLPSWRRFRRARSKKIGSKSFREVAKNKCYASISRYRGASRTHRVLSRRLLPLCVGLCVVAGRAWGLTNCGVLSGSW